MNHTQASIAARLRTTVIGALLRNPDLEVLIKESSNNDRKNDTDDEEEKKDEDNNTSHEESKSEEDKGETKKAESKQEDTDLELSPTAISHILQGDVDEVAKTVTTTVTNLIRSCSSCFVGGYRMVRLSPSLVVIVSLGIAPLVGTIAITTRSYVSKKQAKQQEAAITAASFVQERLNNIALVQGSNRQEEELQSFVKLQEKSTMLGKKSALANGFSMGTMFSLGTGSICSIFLLGGQAVQKGRMSAGDLASFGTYSFLMALGSAGIIRAMTEYGKGVSSAVRVTKLLDLSLQSSTATEKEQDSQTPSIENLTEKISSIEMKNVTFRYKSSKQPVLRDISMQVKRGQVVCLVGKNGSGKSTIASLLSGTYSPSQGSVQIQLNSKSSSVSLSSISRQDQSRLVQVVPQRPALFDLTVRENIIYSNPTASAEEIDRIAKLTHCQELLENDSARTAGLNGCRLSGGQCQKIGLARALLAKPVILILDEPSSSLDAQGTSAVQDAIDACRQANCGLLVISHRAYTLEVADNVVVLQDGSIVEEGSLKDLSTKESVLKSLVNP